jgi:hypothetical protein
MEACPAARLAPVAVGWLGRSPSLGPGAITINRAKAMGVGPKMA